MNKTILTALVAVSVVAMAMPVSGYHIKGNASLTPQGIVLALTSGDFFLPNPLLIACESDGNADPVNPNPAGNEGLGGLCYTGSTGNLVCVDPLLPPPSPTFFTSTGNYIPCKGVPIKKLDYVRLDVCSLTVNQRGGLGPGPTDVGGAADPCLVIAPGGNNNIMDAFWAYTAQLGIYACAISPAGWFEYNDSYAKMTWDAPVAGGNGHVAVFPDLLLSVAGAPASAAAAAAGIAAGGTLVTGSVATEGIMAPTVPSCGSADPVFGPVFGF